MALHLQTHPHLSSCPSVRVGRRLQIRLPIQAKPKLMAWGRWSSSTMENGPANVLWCVILRYTVLHPHVLVRLDSLTSELWLPFDDQQSASVSWSCMAEWGTRWLSVDLILYTGRGIENLVEWSKTCLFEEHAPGCCPCENAFPPVRNLNAQKAQWICIYIYMLAPPKTNHLLLMYLEVGSNLVLC